MTFTVAVIGWGSNGDKLTVHGTFVNADGGTGGDVVTGLRVVTGFTMTPNGAAVAANESAINETLPLINTGGAVTIKTDANISGEWEAEGY